MQKYSSLLILLLLLGSTSHAALIIVDSNQDTLSVDGNCTLREALTAANFDIPFDQCSAGSGDDLIWLLLNVTNDAVQLDTTLPIIDGVTIQGPGADQLVLLPGAGHTSHIFQINTDRDVVLQDFRIGGAQSSAIDVVEVDELTVIGMRFLNNTAGGNNTLGGAIHADLEFGNTQNINRLTVNDSAFIANSAGDGGALAISGQYPVSLNGVVFDQNSAITGGGAVYRKNNSRDVFSANISINQAQFTRNSSNTVGGAILVDLTYLNINQALFHENQGQNVLNIIRSLATVENSLFAENPVGRVILNRNFNASVESTELTLAFNTFLDNQNLDIENNSAGGDLTTLLLANAFDSDNGTKCQGTGTVSLGGNVENNGVSCSLGADDFPNTDPLLLALDLYGGDVLIAPPSPTSPLVDAGFGCDSADLSGEGRPRDGDASGAAQCDIGAVERANAVILTVANNGSGVGQINLNEFELSCYSPDSCDWPLAQGSVADLEPVADTGSTFIQWGGACNGNAGCQVTMMNAQNVTAEFALVANPVTLTVNKDLASTSLDALITSNPGGIVCGNTCLGNYIEGDQVDLLATPDMGTLVAAWTGCDAVSSDGLTCTANLDSDAVVTAFLEADEDLIFANGFDN